MKIILSIFSLFIVFSINAQQFFNTNSPSDETFLNHDIVDVDQDGDEDYLVWSFNKIKWYDEIFNFENEHILYESSFMQFAINKPYLDVNGDGLEDLLFREFNDSLYVINNLGGGEFDTVHPINLGYFTNNSELHDLNNDGVLDKLIQNNDGFNYQINQGNWTFGPMVLIDDGDLSTYSYYYYFPTVMDVNADGFLDLAFRAIHTSQYQTTRNIILLNDSNGQFNTQTDLTFGNTEGQGPIWYCNLLTHQFDYDNDGDLDLYYSTNENVYCITNNNNLTYSEPESVLSSNSIGQINFVDLDFDGVMELQVYSYTNGQQGNYFHIDSNNVLIPMNNSLFYQGSHLIQNVFYRDLDQDGQMDLISLQNKPTYSPSLKSTFHRNISDAHLGVVTEYVCDSFYVLPLNDTIYASYQYLDTITIDSVNFVDIVFGNSIYRTFNKTICSGNDFEFGTQTLVDSGEYIETFTSVYGCDSIVTLNLSLIPQPEQTQQFITTDLCQYYVNGQTYYSDTTFNTIFNTEFDCDSVVEFTLDFVEPIEEEDQYEEINLGTFVPKPNFIEVIDFDEDGDMDILASSKSDLFSLYILEQTTAGHYKNKKYSIERPIDFFVRKDINNDGVLDIVFNEDFGILFHNCGVQISNFELNHKESNKFSQDIINIDANGDNLEDQIVFHPYWDSPFSSVQLKLKVRQPNDVLKEYDILKNSTKDVRDLYGTPLLTDYKYGHFNQDSILDFVLYSLDGPHHNATSYVYLYLSDSNYNYSQKVVHWSYSFTSYKSFIGTVNIVDQNLDGLNDLVYSVRSGGISKNQIIQLTNNGELDSLTFASKTLSVVDPIGYCEPMTDNNFISSISPSLFSKRYNLNIDEYGGSELSDLGPGGPYNEGTIGEGSAVTTLGVFDGDFDGDRDIVLGSTMFRNDGDSNYVFDNTSPLFAKYPDFSHLEDLDGDGDYDFVFRSGLQWAERIDQDSISDLKDLLVYSDLFKELYIGWPSISVDFDNDGDKDVIGYYRDTLTNWHDRNLILLENNGMGELNYHSVIDTVINDFTKYVDLDQDGFSDILLQNGWLKNIENLNFDYQEYPEEIENPQVVLDVDLDGDLDLLSKKDSIIAWYFNDGNENFELGELVTNGATKAIQKLRVYDFDNDGDLDVYSRDYLTYFDYNQGSQHYLYRNSNFSPENPSSNPLPAEDEIEFVVYPNPNSGTFGVMSPYNDLQMTVYSLEGKLLATQVLQQDLNQINLIGHLPSGMYLLTFTKPGEFSKTERLIISK